MILRMAITGMIMSVPAQAQPCAWEALAGTSFGDLVRIRALLPFDDGLGPALYAGGTFREATGSPGDRITRWDGESWFPLGRGLGGSADSLALFNDGRGPALYVGGPFYRAGEIPNANGIARWDGREWSALGTGIRNFTDPPSAHNAAAMVVFDDGSGPALYVGGRFTEAGGAPALNVARWNGEQWSAMGDGVSGYEVRALAIFDDGSGPALYAGGYIDIGGVARWDGQSWSRVGDSFVGYIDAMAVFDDGTGPALYAGGQMHVSSGHPGNGIARWDGERWAPLRGGVDYDVRSMHVFDDGTGPALYVGGAFHYADGKPVWGIAKWDGSEWHELDGGLYHLRGQSVNALTTFDDGAGPALYVAGQFSAAGELPGIPVENIARWRCTGACLADCDGSGDLTFFDFLCFQNQFAAMDPGADCDGDTAFTFFDFLCFQNAFAAGCQ
jgi:hypothetical protein